MHQRREAPLGPFADDIADASPIITAFERVNMEKLLAGTTQLRGATRLSLARLVIPFERYCVKRGCDWRHGSDCIRSLFRGMLRIGRPYWDWTRPEWHDVLARDSSRYAAVLRAVAYESGAGPDVAVWRGTNSHARMVAAIVFGDKFTNLVAELDAATSRLGYRKLPDPAYGAATPLAWMALHKGTVDFGPEDLDRYLIPLMVQSADMGVRRVSFYRLAQVLHFTGVFSRRLRNTKIGEIKRTYPGAAGDPTVPETWKAAVEQYLSLALLTTETKQSRRSAGNALGRWIWSTLRIESPADLDAAACRQVAAKILTARRGEFAGPVARRRKLKDVPLAPHTRRMYLRVLAQLIQGLVAFEALPPEKLLLLRWLRIPRTLALQLKPSPKNIDEPVFAKLLAAGLKLAPEQCPPAYPFEAWRALAYTWLYSGLRHDEIRRLTVGCIKDFTRPGSVGLPEICWLSVPRNKTGVAFDKPVPIEVGEAIRAWEAVRPPDQFAIDRKSGAPEPLLFMHRGRTLGWSVVNRSLIPLLCKIANIPPRDSRGPITSHRTRATVATALHNAEHPMGLLELKEWLGHEDLRSTVHYVRPSATRLAERFNAAMEEIGRVSGFVDREAVRSGAAGRGEPWIYHEVDGGLCSNDAYEACPHRMACAVQCSYHVPGDSARAEVLRASESVLQLTSMLKLKPGEARAASDARAKARLRRKLADVPTPSGLTPRQLRSRPEK